MVYFKYAIIYDVKQERLKYCMEIKFHIMAKI